MPKKQIKVLNQRTSKGTEYSCGFHAAKNSLLGLLLNQSKIDQTKFTQLSQSQPFFESLYDQISPHPKVLTTDISRPEVRSAMKQINNGHVNLEKFGITQKNLTSLDMSQLTTFNIPFGAGDFGNDEMSTALKLHNLAKQTGPAQHVISLGGNFPPTYLEGHWVNLFVDINEQGQRSYTFMDSYQNQTKHYDFIVDSIENILAKDPNQLEEYLLDVYDADNAQFEDLYNRFFDFEGNTIPNDNVQVPDPRHPNQTMPRGCYDDHPLQDQHEWISSTQYAVRHGDDWSDKIETKFNTLKDAGLLENPNERTLEHMSKLLVTAKFIETAPGVESSIVEKMKNVRESLEQKMPSVENNSEEQIVIKILSQPKVPPIEKQIDNIKKHITKLGSSIEVSTQLIDKLNTLSELQTLSKSQTSILSKAQSGLTKKLDHLESLTNRLELATEHQQKYSLTEPKTDNIQEKQQALKDLLKSTRSQSSDSELTVESGPSTLDL